MAMQDTKDMKVTKEKKTFQALVSFVANPSSADRPSWRSWRA
jgi:hypothetical protein